MNLQPRSQGVTYQTQVYEDCSDADWDEEFEWPLASQIDPSEYVEVQVLNHNKIFSNRVVGIFRMVLQRLIQEQHLSITDSLLDSNNTVLKAQISLELTYTPPTGSVAEWIGGLNPTEPLYMDSETDGSEIAFSQSSKRRRSRMSLPAWPKKENGSVDGSLLSLQSADCHKKKKSHIGIPTPGSALFDEIRRSNSGGGGGNPNQLGVVAGPFGQMLAASKKEEGGVDRGSRRGSTHSLISTGSGSTKFHQHPKVRIEPKEAVKDIDYQVQIRVNEARQLSGMQLDPVCTVLVGGQKKHTAIKEQTNTPFWDEFFVFDFKMPAMVLFDKIINFQVFTGRNLVSQGQLIGSFKLDIGTVYAQPDHRFIRRWAVLTDPEETLGASGAGVKYQEPGDMHEDDNTYSIRIHYVGAPECYRLVQFVTVAYNGDLDHSLKIYVPALVLPFLAKLSFQPYQIIDPHGYLKVDITVLGKGDPIKEPPSVKDNDDDIDANLLLPDGVPAERPKARIVVKIYKAEGLPKMNSGLMANVKKAFTGEVRDLADPYVEVAFAGHKARTSVKKHTYEPEWNEQITFAELFPPLCRRIKVQLKDSDSVTDEVVGTQFIDLSQISNDGANGWLRELCCPQSSSSKKKQKNVKNEAPKVIEGFMPTFGPCWVNLYGSTRDFSLLDEHSSLNEGLGEGVAYRGRLLMAVQAEMGESASDASIKQVEIDATPPISDTAAGKEDTFQLFACIYEASMIERKSGEKPVQFEMSIGNHGNTMDGQVIPEDPVVKKEKEKEEADGDEERFTHSITPKCKPKSGDRQYYYLELEDTKPCMHIKVNWQDHRRRLYLSNMLYRICEKLNDGLEDVHEKDKLDLGDTYQTLRIVLKDLIRGCRQFINICENKISGPTVGKTKLDRERQKLCINEVRNIYEQTSQVMESVHDNTHIKENVRTAMEFLKRLQTVQIEPQQALPDIFIWMLSGGKRVAYARIPAEDIIYSQVDWEKGRHAGKIQSVFLKLPGKRGDGPKGWAIQAKLDVLFWLGLHKHKKEFLKDAPKGYQMPKGANKAMAPPPNQLTYTEKQKFLLRSHIYQARSLIGSDASGLSDAFARVIFSSLAADTRVIWETRSPTWDQMLMFQDVIIWGDIHEIAINPPTIVIEIFDKDIGGDSEFIGRALARPIVKMAHEKYEKPNFPPALEWFEICRGDEKAGELLAAFELLQVVDTGKCFLPDEVEPVNTPDGPIVPVPDGIRPIMKKHRIEVLFWGVREMKRVNLTTVDRPQVDVDCAGQVVQSTVIVNAKRNPNFSQPVTYFDVELPENERYCPPLTIRVRDCRTFGRFTLVGTHVVNSLHRYLQDPGNYKQDDDLKKRTDFGNKKLRKSTEDNFSRPQSPAVQLPPPKEEQVLVEIGDPTEEETAEKVEEKDAQKGPRGRGEKEKNKEEEEDDEDSLDWWSRYYETVKDIEREEEELERAEAEKDAAKPAKKEKKDKTTQDVKPVKKPNPKITRIKIYKCELENLNEFFGFNDWLYSFPLYRGKKTSEDEDDEHRIVGKFKGALKVWKYPLPKFLDLESLTGSFTRLPSNEPVNVLIRCYVIRALDLHPTDVNGKADPYLVITCGKQKTKDRDNYIAKQLNPIFGRVFDFEAIIPMDNMLTVSIYDYDLVGSDDLIGETKIDVENRFYSKHRPICGLSTTYTTFGFNKWRDPLKPTQILQRICKDEGLDGPHYASPGKCRIENIVFSASPLIMDEAGNQKSSDEPAALKALHNFHTIPKKGYHLTPEYVETRSLYNPEKPGIEQGKVEMWIDLFAMDMPSPGAPVDITPRKPTSYELRVVIWNTEDVLMDEVNLVTGEACSDIYVKGWIEGMKDEKQQTDVHYRSLTGEGNFNWRMIFPFQYQKAEEKIVIKRKANFFSWDESEEKVPARLTLQVWDADAFSADDFIGDCCLDMVRMPRGAKTSKTCSLDTMKTDRPVSLLKLKHIKGWWPFAVNTDLEEIELAGKVEAELELLTQEEAEKAPAGLAREEPQPLDKPNRPDTSFTWFMNPFKSLRYMIWEQYKFCLLKFLVIGLLIALMGLFFYSMPGYTVKKIFNA